MQVAAYGLTFLSMYLQAHRGSLWGPAVGVLSSIPWIILTILWVQPWMFLFEAALLVLSIRQFLHWRAENANHNGLPIRPSRLP